MTFAPKLVQGVTTWYQQRTHLDPGVLMLVMLFLLLLPLSTPRIYATDEVQYYAYLRSVYFDGDLDFTNEYTYFAEQGLAHDDPAIYNALLLERNDDPPRNADTGLLRNVAPIGSAVMWAPGFILADGMIRLGNAWGGSIPADGFSQPYIQAVCFMSALYTFLGLLLCYRLARRYSGVFAATLATATVWLASPLLFYSLIAMPLSHAPAFFLVSLFLTVWLWDGERTLLARRAARPWWQWALLGAIGGLMTITREQLGLLLLMPAVEGLVAYGVLLRERGQWRRIAQLFTGHVVFLVGLALLLAPQVLTYQILNGRPLPSTTVSGKVGAASGLSPHFFDTLFHPAHGAFLWSPVLLAGLVGLVWLARHDRLLAVLLLLGFLAQTYVNGAFGTTWHLSGAFGFRRLIECTPIFILGLAALLEWLRPRVGWLPLVLVAGFLVYWNIGLLVQWALVRPSMRAGLIWQDMLYYQFVEVPGQLVTRLHDLLFNRCRLVRNQTC